MSKERAKRNDNVNWPKVKIVYETGKYDLRELGRMFACSEATIRYQARKDGWLNARKAILLAEKRQRTRDKRRAKQTREKAKVKADVLRTVYPVPANQVTQDDLVDLIAKQNKDIIEGHREDLLKARTIAGVMIEELGICTVDPGRLAEALNNFASLEKMSMTNSLDKAQMITRIKAALTLVARSQIMKNLSGALANLINLERQAYDLDLKGGELPKDHVPLEDRVKHYTQITQATGTDNVVPFNHEDSEK